MTTSFIILLVIFGLLKIIVTSIPNSVVESIARTFELHPTLKDEQVTITFQNKQIEGEEKTNILHAFNEATFVERHYFPPQYNETPVLIHVKNEKKQITFSLYAQEEYVDIVKQVKKKVIAYRILSKHLQECRKKNQ